MRRPSHLAVSFRYIRGITKKGNSLSGKRMTRRAGLSHAMPIATSREQSACRRASAIPFRPQAPAWVLSRIDMGCNGFTKGQRRDAGSITTALANATGAAPCRLLCCEIIHNLPRTLAPVRWRIFFSEPLVENPAWRRLLRYPPVPRFLPMRSPSFSPRPNGSTRQTSFVGSSKKPRRRAPACTPLAPTTPSPRRL
jgi:hypothetical protein